jgi:hypothetical protein
LLRRFNGIPDLIGTAMTALRSRRHNARARRCALCIAAAALLILSFVQNAAADNPWARSRNAWGSKPNAWGSTPNAWGNSKTPYANSQNAWGRSSSSKDNTGTPSNFSGYMAIPSEAIVALPSMEPRLKKHVDTGAIRDGLDVPPRPAKRKARAQQKPRHCPSPDPSGTCKAEPN